MVHDDELDSVLSSQKFTECKSQIFDLLQEMINLDNDASLRKQDACTSQISSSSDDDFEVLSDFSDEEKSSDTSNIDEIEQYNIADLQVVASQISNVISPKQPSFASRVLSQREEQENGHER